MLQVLKSLYDLRQNAFSYVLTAYLIFRVQFIIFLLKWLREQINVILSHFLLFFMTWNINYLYIFFSKETLCLQFSPKLEFFTFNKTIYFRSNDLFLSWSIIILLLLIKRLREQINIVLYPSIYFFTVRWNNILIKNCLFVTFLKMPFLILELNKVKINYNFKSENFVYVTQPYFLILIQVGITIFLSKKIAYVVLPTNQKSKTFLFFNFFFFIYNILI